MFGLLRRIKRALVNGGTTIVVPDRDEVNRVLLGQLLSEAKSQVRLLDGFEDAEFRVFSQFGEDGILQYITRNLPEIPKTFVEIGVEDYKEANTRFLVMKDHWKGLLVEGDPGRADAIRNDPILWRNSLHLLETYVDSQNINDLLSSKGICGEIGLMSLDIDGIDYWVLKKLQVVQPWVIVLEYNAIFGDQVKVTVPDDSAFRRLAAHHSGLYFGASLNALVALADDKGYGFLGCNSAGNNAFFLRKDLTNTALPFAPVDRGFRPASFSEGRDEDGSLNLGSWKQRLQQVEELNVVELTGDQTVKIKELEINPR